MKTFFSRTLSLGCRLEVWLGGCYRKVQGLDLIPLRVPVLIWLPDGPLGARRCAVGPVQVVSLLDTVVVCIVGGICFSWSIWPSSTGSEPMLFIVNLLSLSNRGFMLSLSTVFVRLSFSHNCLPLCPCSGL